jgi:hypothetical protein
MKIARTMSDDVCSLLRVASGISREKIKVIFIGNCKNERSKKKLRVIINNNNCYMITFIFKECRAMIVFLMYNSRIVKLI